MDSLIKFFVPGIPKPGGSKIPAHNKDFSKIWVRDASKNKDWKRAVAMYARQAYQGKPLTGAVLFTFAFVMPRPKYHYGTGKNATTLKPDAPTDHIIMPDSTKITRSTEDALKGILWVDDSQVVSQLVTKQYGEVPGVHISVMPRIESVKSTQGVNNAPHPMDSQLADTPST